MKHEQVSQNKKKKMENGAVLVRKGLMFEEQQGIVSGKICEKLKYRLSDKVSI